jgi:hypothetical protein
MEQSVSYVTVCSELFHHFICICKEEYGNVWVGLGCMVDKQESATLYKLWY